MKRATAARQLLVPGGTAAWLALSSEQLTGEEKVAAAGGHLQHSALLLGDGQRVQELAHRQRLGRALRLRTEYTSC